MLRRSLLISFCFIAIAVFVRVGTAQTTTFSYQGSLNSGGDPASGSHDFEFALFDAESGGTQLGSTITVNTVPVTNGIFTVSLDFGSQFPGEVRFLEIRVRPAGGGAFTLLTPRQQITSSPYAVKSLNADGLAASCNLCVTDAQISALSASKITGTVPIANGGTGATTEADARTNLGLGTLATISPTGTPGAATFLRGDNTWASASNDIVASINTQFSQDDRAGWTRIDPLPDDNCNTGIPLGFTFTGWGRNITTVGINNNGFLIFGNTCPTTGSWNNVVLPSSVTTDPFVAFFWDDLIDEGPNEYIEYQTSGSPGGRVFNMFFRNRHLSGSCGTDDVNIMLAIHEGSNLVRISYSNMSGCAEMRGSSATFGMQGPGGAAARAFNAGTNTPILDDNANRNMISFTPPRQ